MRPNKNAKIRNIFSNGITEDEFIERFDELMEFIGFNRFVPYNEETKALANLEKIQMRERLEKIHRMNPTKNKWADINNISDKLKIFLKLKEEDL